MNDLIERDRELRERDTRRDEEDAQRYPLADRLAQDFHRKVYYAGRAYYEWDRMDPSYRLGIREQMQFVVDLVGEDAVTGAFEGTER